MIRIFFGALFSYLAGAIPTAFIFAKIMKNVDIRDYGSGNVGATNALRVLGKLPAAFVLFL
ncbi:MAG: glycerol-3-phosphate acyltransferase, partial [Candidatus Omnitrophica bacterium]|nr:glycerol-3-phosphate acyltransferase [Candidatus Omnitrophota bacterium]